MPRSSRKGKSLPYCFFQTFLLENSHLPLRQVNAFMNFMWEKIQPPPPPFPKFKVIKICFWTRDCQMYHQGQSVCKGSKSKQLARNQRPVYL